ncbi:MAG: cytochrome c1 [Candidatus Obscuribacterales bacterium]|nr:cytochrome c1 [Steroidobacteraceae bacterium]
MLTNKKFKLACVASLLSLCISTIAYASGDTVKLLHAGNDVANQASLQRGARNFVNYCYGCHSAQYVRYNRVATDLGLTEQQTIDFLMFTGKRPSDTMKNAMSVEDGQRWFGKEPPDLSLIARSRTPDYLYTFLKSFYVDSSRSTGTNNTVLPGASMPHVLAELQGLQKAVYEGEADKDGNMQKHFKGFEQLSKGTLAPDEYDNFVRDTVNFLEYIGEPVQMKRRSLGVGVLFFLLVFLGFTYFLKKEYWKDVK